MQKEYKAMRECIYHNPHGLPHLSGKLRSIADSYLPYKTGIEIECRQKRYGLLRDLVKEKENDYYFHLVDLASEEYEQKFQIPCNTHGYITLYETLEIFKKSCFLNPKSGIHYHIDLGQHVSSFGKKYPIFSATPGYDPQFQIFLLQKGFMFILSELEKWGYKGSYNSKKVSPYKGPNWVNFRSDYQTIEIRIGEMTFDYSLMIKRILHCQAIVKKLLTDYKKYCDQNFK